MATAVSRVVTRLAKSSAKNSPFTLFDYQLNALDNVVEAIDRGVRRVAVVLATGGGKTVVFSHLIPLLEAYKSELGRVIGEKTLVLAHRAELVYQAASTIKKVNPDLKVSIDMAERHYDETADVIVASVMTLTYKTRLLKYNPLDFKTIILDECHHSAAASWTKILTYFGANTPELEVNVVGFTATFERADEKDLSAIFDEVVYRRTLLEMIVLNQLCDMLFLRVQGDYSLDNIKSYSGDYSVSQLEEAVNNSKNNALVADAYLKLKRKYDFKTTIVFCVGVAHCKSVCNALQHEGVNAQYVTGTTAKKEREQLIADFLNGEIDVLCNVGVFTEGFDVPRVDSIIMARPTKSRVLAQQMIGRGLRKHPLKSVCYIGDVCGMEGKMMDLLSILTGLEVSDDVDGKKFSEISGHAPDKDPELKTPRKPASLVDEMSDYLLLNLVKDLDNLSIDEIGNVSHFANMTITTEDTSNIKAFMNAQPGNWVWLSNEEWALRIDSNQFVSFQVNKEKNKFDVTIRELNKTKFNGKYRERNTILIERIGTYKDLIEAMNEVKKMDFETTNWSIYYRKWPSKKQIDFISNILEKRIKDQFRADAKDFDTKLASQSMLFCSNLIFAFNYSIKFPCVNAMINHVMRS